MRLRLKELAELHEARTGKKLKLKELGKDLYPDSSEASARQGMYTIMNKEIPSAKLEWFSVIHEKYDVDANFILGQPSKHDEEYKNLITDKN